MSEPTNITLQLPSIHERNYLAIAGVVVTCEECGHTGRLNSGSWAFAHGDNGVEIYCYGCAKAEAQE